MKRYNMKHLICRNLFGILLLSLITVNFSSCKDDDESSKKGFMVTPEALDDFQDNGGVQKVSVSSNEEWTAETSAEWCMVSPANGTGDAVCEVRVDSSYLYDGRVATIKFVTKSSQYKELKISQFGYKPVIKLAKESDKEEVEEVSVPNYAKEEEAFVDIRVSSNVSYTLDIKYEGEYSGWLTCDKKSHTAMETIPRPEKFRFKFATYTGFKADRVAIVTFSGKRGNEVVEKTLRIVQEKSQKIIPSREGDSLALIAIERGLGNYAAWDYSRPITSWNDVITEPLTYTYIDELGNKEQRRELRVVGVRFFGISTKESIPFEIQYLDSLRTLIVASNSNSQLNSIKLGVEITKLKALRSLNMMGYGISALPEEMADMPNLEELFLNGNSFMEIPLDVLKRIPNLKAIDFGGNRIFDGIADLSSNKKDSIGIDTELPQELFTLDNLEYISLSYNYLQGTIPELPAGHTMEKLETFAINLNRLEGSIPNWVLTHPNLACWTPYIFVFTQEGKTMSGKNAGFDNVPGRLHTNKCPFWDTDKEDEGETGKGEDDAIFDNQSKITLELPLSGNWRYYYLLNKKNLR